MEEYEQQYPKLGNDRFWAMLSTLNFHSERK